MRPYVIISAAVSIDGYLDDRSPDRLLLSNDADFDRVDALRASCDAILVGAGTLRADNPRLVIRNPKYRAKRRRDPVKVTLTRSGGLNPQWRFFQVGDAEKLVYCPREKHQALYDSLQTAATIIPFPKSPPSDQPMDQPASQDAEFILADLYTRGVRRLLIEGGAAMNTLFLTGDRLVDELQLAIAPFFVGDSLAPRLVNSGQFFHDSRHPLILDSIKPLDGMIIATYRFSRVTDKDRNWLQQTIELSRQCPRSETSYAVGAVIVDAEANQVATGYSLELGERMHAEEVALEKMKQQKRDGKGMTMYTSMEPCSVRKSGKRSCTEHILEAGFERVVYALKEPPLFVQCEGTKRLSEQGVQVDEAPDLAGLVIEVNQHLFKNLFPDAARRDSPAACCGSVIDNFSDAYRWLSNFWPVTVTYERVAYPSVEHAYQAAKTRNRHEREMIRMANTAGEAKRLSKKIEIRPDWKDIKLSVMEDLLRQKFENEELAEKLLETGDTELIEGNTWNDTFWGVCQGQGENWLGRLIMKIRNELKAKQA